MSCNLKDVHLSYFNNSCRFFLLRTYYFRNKAYSNERFVVSTVSYMQLHHYVLHELSIIFYTQTEQPCIRIFKAFFCCPRVHFYHVLLIPLTVLSYTSCIISQSSTIPINFSFRRTLRVAKNIFQIPPIINIGKSLYIYISLSHAIPLCLCRRAFIRPSESFIANRP